MTLNQIKGLSANVSRGKRDTKSLKGFTVTLNNIKVK